MQLDPHDKQFWIRTGVVASALWVGGVVIASATMRDFRWFLGYRHEEFGPATIAAAVGVMMILALTFGIPWIWEKPKA